MRYKVRELREKAGMTQRELAQRAGITRATLWRLETEDDYTTTTKTLMKIATVLKVPIEELFLEAKV